jgi:hypothetical protein
MLKKLNSIYYFISIIYAILHHIFIILQTYTIFFTLNNFYIIFFANLAVIL